MRIIIIDNVAPICNVYTQFVLTSTRKLDPFQLPIFFSRVKMACSSGDVFYESWTQ